MMRALARRGHVVADPLVGLLLQHPQQLHLKVEGQVAHLVEEERPAGGRLEAAGPVAGGAGEGAAHVAEQLALEQLPRQGGGVDGHEGAAPADRLLVDDPGGDLLAGAALAGDEHGGLAVLQDLQQPQHLPHRLRAADQPEAGHRAGERARLLVGRPDDQQVAGLGVADAVGVVLERGGGDREQAGLAAIGPQEGAPALPLLPGGQRQPQRPLRPEQLRPQDGLDLLPLHPAGGAGAEQVVEPVGGVAHAEVAVEGHAEPPQRSECCVDGGEGRLAGVGRLPGASHRASLTRPASV